MAEQVSTNGAPMLRVEGLKRQFGGLMAVNGVSLSVAPGERRAIIGPNGAGKTTLFNLISGELHPSAGRVYLGGEDVTALPNFERARRGLARTFQRNNLFLGLTVRENVRLAVQARRKVASRLWTPVDHLREVGAEADAVLAELGLAEQAHTPVRNLSYGEQRQVEIAIALATRPRVLLLDEPTAGMSPAETTAMTHLVAALPRDMTLLIIEHDMDVVFALADRITVLHYGEVLAEGAPQEVSGDPRVAEVYMGLESA
ncbi:MAG: ABC transporter ATP-binding protein [Chloroflexi bacterium]|nr:ABC transporter ATP-binding protein [Chloroflexota bacterium]